MEDNYVMCEWTITKLHTVLNFDLSLSKKFIVIDLSLSRDLSLSLLKLGQVSIQYAEIKYTVIFQMPVNY